MFRSPAIHIDVCLQAICGPAAALTNPTFEATPFSVGWTVIGAPVVTPGLAPASVQGARFTGSGQSLAQKVSWGAEWSVENYFAIRSTTARAYSLIIALGSQANGLNFRSEFSADGTNTVLDEDGARPDWIELRIPNPFTLNLAGYGLTDTNAPGDDWIFPLTNIPPVPSADSDHQRWSGCQKRREFLRSSELLWHPVDGRHSGWTQLPSRGRIAHAGLHGQAGTGHRREA